MSLDREKKREEEIDVPLLFAPVNQGLVIGSVKTRLATSVMTVSISADWVRLRAVAYFGQKAWAFAPPKRRTTNAKNTKTAARIGERSGGNV